MSNPNGTENRKRVGVYDRPARAGRQRWTLVALIVVAIVATLVFWMWPERAGAAVPIRCAEQPTHRLLGIVWALHSLPAVRAGWQYPAPCRIHSIEPAGVRAGS